MRFEVLHRDSVVKVEDAAELRVVLSDDEGVEIDAKVVAVAE